MEKRRYERPLIKPIKAMLPGKVGTDAYLSPVLDIDGVPIERLMREYGSPLFVFSEEKLRSNIQSAKRAFSTRYPNVQFAWSYKTNYLDGICQLFHDEGSWAEVVSGFEFDKALQNGVPGSQILFNGPSKSKADLLKAVQKGAFIHIDNLDELYLLSEVADECGERPKVALRVNLDAGLSQQWDRFGFNYENGQAWETLCKMERMGKFDLKGLHCHIGTFILTTKAYAMAAEKMARLALRVSQELNVRLEYIDLGGGFASHNTLKASYLGGPDISPSFDDYAEAITSAIYKVPMKASELPMLVLETGRALVDDAGYLLSTVLSNKRSAAGRRYTVIDAGVNLLFTSFWYDHKISPAQPYSKYFEDVTLFGPLCMNIDMIREYVCLPLLNRGDHLVIHNVGAYNVTQWMQFITLRPNVVLVDRKGSVSLLRNAETLQDVKGKEMPIK
ncbi:MAG: alanine racemase [Paludibacteraceae bacterium]|nr:alanine racemase [Paludibacteraceae bacterium]MBR4839044.1 alanine racemase [Paludibacteraceae bacterium]